MDYFILEIGGIDMRNKYNIGDKVRTKIYYQNDRRKEVEATILAVELESTTNKLKYKIGFEPDDCYKKQGCTGCHGYVYQDDVIELVIE